MILGAKDPSSVNQSFSCTTVHGAQQFASLIRPCIVKSGWLSDVELYFDVMLSMSNSPCICMMGGRLCWHFGSCIILWCPVCKYLFLWSLTSFGSVHHLCWCCQPDTHRRGRNKYETTSCCASIIYCFSLSNFL